AAPGRREERSEREIAFTASLQAQVPRLQQERARRSYEALLDGAERLFARRGYDAVGTPEIAAEADVAVGTFYRYFDDKKQIFLEIVRRYLLHAYHQTLDRLTPERFIGKARRETIEETVGILFEYVHRQPGLNRVLVEMSLRDRDVARLRAEFETAACQRLTALITATCPRSEVPDPEATAWVLQAAALECATSVADELLGAPERGLRAHQPEGTLASRVRATLTLVIERMLFPGDAGPPHTSR
ncbi:MAG TPA: helix-turn-helix domain-containing protein, partial [Kofleriaceae bacterium]|nr:helix-turn-helix domain-containing protein [Kofleriaceae bacterium]